jgi:hypothetical protein
MSTPSCWSRPGKAYLIAQITSSRYTDAGARDPVRLVEYKFPNSVCNSVLTACNPPFEQ